MEKRWNLLIRRFISKEQFKLKEIDIQSAYEILNCDYSDIKRHYHTIDHVKELVESLDKFFCNLLSQRERDLVELAIWFHDIDYDYRAPVGINEKYSAKRLSIFCKIIDLDTETTNQLIDLVMATTHINPQSTVMGKVICDLDLLGLSDNTKYFRNRDNVRLEYKEITDKQWLKGRRKFLDWMLSKETIFQTGFFKKYFEESARHNLIYELDYFY